MKYHARARIAVLPPLAGLFRLILGMCMVVGISSCVTSDPEAETLKTQIDKNPRPDAIVGLWHRKNTGLTSPYTGTFLFKTDGTAYFTNTSSRAMHNYVYFYQGGGVWELFYVSSFNGARTPAGTASLSGGRLCYTASGETWIYDRKPENDAADHVENSETSVD